VLVQNKKVDAVLVVNVEKKLVVAPKRKWSL
jgi:hypothetical protein